MKKLLLLFIISVGYCSHTTAMLRLAFQRARCVPVRAFLQHARSLSVTPRVFARCHDILGVPSNVNQKQLKEAYLLLVREWHPDRFSNKADQQEATKKLQDINAAYEEAREYAHHKTPHKTTHHNTKKNHKKQKKSAQREKRKKIKKHKKLPKTPVTSFLEANKQTLMIFLAV